MPVQSCAPRTRLETLKTDLEHALRMRAGIEIVQAADPIDEIAEKAERELLVARLDGIALQHRAVVAALKRLDNGVYGECTECEEPISEKRLAAVPWAALCLSCQERLERHGGGRDHGGEALNGSFPTPRTRLDEAA